MEEDEEEDFAARKIQRGFRGFRAKVMLRELVRKNYIKIHDKILDRYLYKNRTTGEISEEKPRFLGESDLPTPKHYESPYDYTPDDPIDDGYAVFISNTVFPNAPKIEIPHHAGLTTEHFQLHSLFSHDYIGRFNPENVTEIKNGTRSEIIETFDRLRRYCSKRPFLVIYISTTIITLHGADKRYPDETVYFATKDTVWTKPPQIADTCLSLTHLSTLINRIACERKVIVLSYAHLPCPKKSFFPSKRVLYPPMNTLSRMADLTGAAVLGCCSIGTRIVSLVDQSPLEAGLPVQSIFSHQKQQQQHELKGKAKRKNQQDILHYQQHVTLLSQYPNLSMVSFSPPPSFFSGEENPVRFAEIQRRYRYNNNIPISASTYAAHSLAHLNIDENHSHYLLNNSINSSHIPSSHQPSTQTYTQYRSGLNINEFNPSSSSSSTSNYPTSTIVSSSQSKETQQQQQQQQTKSFPSSLLPIFSRNTTSTSTNNSISKLFSCLNSTSKSSSSSSSSLSSSSSSLKASAVIPIFISPTPPMIPSFEYYSHSDREKEIIRERLITDWKLILHTERKKLIPPEPPQAKWTRNEIDKSIEISLPTDNDFIIYYIRRFCYYSRYPLNYLINSYRAASDWWRLRHLSGPEQQNIGDDNGTIFARLLMEAMRGGVPLRANDLERKIEAQEEEDLRQGRKPALVINSRASRSSAKDSQAASSVLGMVVGVSAGPGSGSGLGGTRVGSTNQWTVEYSEWEIFQRYQIRVPVEEGPFPLNAHPPSNVEFFPPPPLFMIPPTTSNINLPSTSSSSLSSTTNMMIKLETNQERTHRKKKEFSERNGLISIYDIYHYIYTQLKEGKYINPDVDGEYDPENDKNLQMMKKNLSVSSYNPEEENKKDGSEKKQIKGNKQKTKDGSRGGGGGGAVVVKDSDSSSQKGKEKGKGKDKGKEKENAETNDAEEDSPESVVAVASSSSSSSSSSKTPPPPPRKGLEILSPVLVFPQNNPLAIHYPFAFRCTPPPSPGKPYIIKAGPTEVLLEWYDPPFDGVPPSHYSLSLRSPGTRNYSQWSPLPHPNQGERILKNRFLVRYLAKGVPVQFRVVAHSAGGSSPPSQETMVLTPGEENAPIPPNIRWRKINLSGPFGVCDRLNQYPYHRVDQLKGLTSLLVFANETQGFKMKKNSNVSLTVARCCIQAMKNFEDDIEIAEKGLGGLGWVLRGPAERKIKALLTGPNKLIDISEYTAHYLEKYRWSTGIVGACAWVRYALGSSIIEPPPPPPVIEDSEELKKKKKKKTKKIVKPSAVTSSSLTSNASKTKKIEVEEEEEFGSDESSDEEQKERERERENRKMNRF